MDVNVKGTLFLSQALLPLMHSKDANIINVGSDAGLTGNYGCPLYCASKGAVVALTRALALDYAGRVRVNCVCPGDVATPMVAAQLATGNYTASELAAPYPVGRIGEPQEIAHMLCAIASPMNSFMTGAIIAIDGGLTAS
ncbi:MAG: SDR family oxidoreductase, partial [Acidaminococcaceae bacterium]